MHRAQHAQQLAPARPPTCEDQSIMAEFIRYCTVSISLAASPHRSCRGWAGRQPSGTQQRAATASSRPGCTTILLQHNQSPAPQPLLAIPLPTPPTCSRSKSVRLRPLRAAASLMTVGGSCGRLGGGRRAGDQQGQGAAAGSGAGAGLAGDGQPARQWIAAIPADLPLCNDCTTSMASGWSAPLGLRTLCIQLQPSPPSAPHLTCRWSPASTALRPLSSAAQQAGSSACAHPAARSLESGERSVLRTSVVLWSSVVRWAHDMGGSRHYATANNELLACAASSITTTSNCRRSSWRWPTPVSVVHTTWNSNGRAAAQSGS